MRARGLMVVGALAALVFALPALAGCAATEAPAVTNASASERSSAAVDEATTPILVGPALYEFYTAWCPGCIAMRPVIDRVRPDYEDALDFNLYDVEEDGAGRALMKELLQGYVPAFYVVDETGAIVDEWVGERSEKDVRATLDALIGEPRSSQRPEWAGNPDAQKPQGDTDPVPIDESED